MSQFLVCVIKAAFLAFVLFIFVILNKILSRRRFTPSKLNLTTEDGDKIIYDIICSIQSFPLL